MNRFISSLYLYFCDVSLDPVLLVHIWLHICPKKSNHFVSSKVWLVAQLRTSRSGIWKCQPTWILARTSDSSNDSCSPGPSIWTCYSTLPCLGPLVHIVHSLYRDFLSQMEYNWQPWTTLLLQTTARSTTASGSPSNPSSIMIFTLKNFPVLHWQISAIKSRMIDEHLLTWKTY